MAASVRVHLRSTNGQIRTDLQERPNFAIPSTAAHLPQARSIPHQQAQSKTSRDYEEVDTHTRQAGNPHATGSTPTTRLAASNVTLTDLSET